ncbi:MAG: ribokinase [Candidatus Latescibacterota bacterium]|nr:ribokinase [Candidatus Latescibacterota bacterium]
MSKDNPPKRVLCFGSLNIDHVYRVRATVRPGATIPSSNYSIFAGGKGGNQSAALAHAGARVWHGGRVGEDGRWLLRGLEDLGVDVGHVIVDPECPTGHAIIQVEDGGENAIFLFAGTNQEISITQIETCLSDFHNGDILLLQNEISNIHHLLWAARERGMTVCLNPSPLTQDLAQIDLSAVDILVVNEGEAAGLSGRQEFHREDEESLLNELANLLPGTGTVVMSLGARGAMLCEGSSTMHIAATSVDAMDTTAAGDTLIGYFLAGRAAGIDASSALRRATAAAALCVTRVGARDSIPLAAEVDDFMGSYPNEQKQR